MPILGGEAVVEHARGRQADHLDKLVDDDARPRNREMVPFLQG
jgi:hypothetical protein